MFAVCINGFNDSHNQGEGGACLVIHFDLASSHLLARFCHDIPRSCSLRKDKSGSVTETMRRTTFPTIMSIVIPLKKRENSTEVHALTFGDINKFHKPTHNLLHSCFSPFFKSVHNVHDYSTTSCHNLLFYSFH